MELGELPRSKNTPENEAIHGAVQLACMSEPEAWKSIRTDGWRILPAPAAGVATASGGIPGELDQKGDPGREKRSEE